MNIWTFLGIAPQQIRLLDQVSKTEIVNKPGIYLFLALEGIEYRYPKGDSPIFYVGMSEALCKRLSDHRSRVCKVANGNPAGIEWPRFEYAAAHGCRVAAFPSSTQTRAELLSLEADVIALFAKTYGAPPIANGSASPNKTLRRSPSAPPQGLTASSWLCDTTAR